MENHPSCIGKILRGKPTIDGYSMWVKQCHKPSLSHHHKYVGGMTTILEWVINIIGLRKLVW